MRTFLVLCMGIAGHGGAERAVAAAAVPPPGPSSHRGGNESYRRNDDIPVVGDRFRRRSDDERGRRGGDGARRRRRRSRRSRKRRGDDDDGAYDGSSDGGEDAPPLFFLDQEQEEDRWREQRDYDRRRRRRGNRRNDDRPTLAPFRRWALEKTGLHIPRVNLHFDPTTILKLRKSWHGIVPGAIVRVGADFETHSRLGHGLWRLRGCVEDKLVGGRFTIKERQTGEDGERAVLMEYSKSWLFAGAGESTHQ